MRAASWAKLLRLAEQRTVVRMRGEGKSAPEIEIALLMADGWLPDLVSEEELGAILAKHPDVRESEAAQKALRLIREPPPPPSPPLVKTPAQEEGADDDLRDDEEPPTVFEEDDWDSANEKLEPAKDRPPSAPRHRTSETHPLSWQAHKESQDHGLVAWRGGPF
jgi:hypothetical protein